MRFFFIFFWLVIISFILWGVGGINDYDRNVVVTIGKYKAGIDEYRDTYDRLYELYRKIYQERLNDELLKKLDIKRKAVEEIIQRRLLLLEAKRMGIKVRDEEVRESILNSPAFQKDGRFNNELYLRILQLNHLTPEGFMQIQKEDLTLGKIRRILSDSVVVTDEELKESLIERLKSEGKPFKEEEFENLKGMLKGLFLKEKQDKAIASYVESLKAKTRIIINERLLG